MGANMHKTRPCLFIFFVNSKREVAQRWIRPHISWKAHSADKGLTLTAHPWWKEDDHLPVSFSTYTVWFSNICLEHESERGHNKTACGLIVVLYKRRMRYPACFYPHTLWPDWIDWSNPRQAAVMMLLYSCVLNEGRTQQYSAKKYNT